VESQDKLHTGGTEKGSKKAFPTDLRRVGNGGSADRGTAENEKEQNGKQVDERDSDKWEEFDQKRCLQCKKNTRWIPTAQSQNISPTNVIIIFV
jgi:hypothetical protein